MMMITEQQYKNKNFLYPFLIGILSGIGMTWSFIEITDFYVRRDTYEKLMHELNETKVKLINTENELKIKQDSMNNMVKNSQILLQGKNSKGININGNDNKINQ